MKTFPGTCRRLLCLCLAVALTVALCLPLAAAGDANPATDGQAAASAVAAASMLDAPAGKYGFVTTQNGHFVYSGTGQRAKFWGVNVVFAANFPAKAKAEEMAEDIASLGFNLVRLHGFDSSNGTSTNLFANYTKSTRSLSASQLDKLDYFIYQLKIRGVYVNINLNSKRLYASGDGVTDYASMSKLRWTQLYDDHLIMLQQEFAEQFLTHVNPYTNTSYANEPAVAMMELINENSIAKAWVDGNLDSKITTYYSNELTEKWNLWLADKYSTNTAMLQAWGLASSKTAGNMVSNGDFTSSFVSGWKTLLTSKAAATLSYDSSTKSSGSGGALKVAVSGKGSDTSSLNLYQPGISLTKGKTYTVSLDIRTDAAAAWPVVIAVAGVEFPYPTYGLAKKASVPKGTSFTTITFEGTATATVSGVALALQIGGVAGTMWIDNAVVEEKAATASTTIGNYALGNVPWIRLAQRGSYPRAALYDFEAFLVHIESSFNTTMMDYLKNELGVKVPVSGNNQYSGMGSLAGQTVCDYMNAHSYYDHPLFPSGTWSRTSFGMKNTSMVQALAEDTGSYRGYFGLMAMCAVEGMPTVVSEWNLPFPNQYEYEAIPVTAAVAAVQDWDAMILFAYYHGEAAKNTGINNFFDVIDNPVKRAQLPLAALMFLRGDLAAASQSVTLEYSQADTLLHGAQDTYTGNLYAANLSTAALYDTILKVGTFTAGATGSYTTGAGNTGQFKWGAGSENYVTVNTPAFQAVTGFVAGQTVALDSLEVSLDNDAAVALAALDTKDITTAGSLLLNVAGKQANTSQAYDANNGLSSWGRAPTVPEAVKGRVRVRLERPEACQVFAVDETGAQLSELKAAAADGWLSFEVAGESMLYQIVNTGAGPVKEKDEIMVDFLSELVELAAGESHALAFTSNVPNAGDLGWKIESETVAGALSVNGGVVTALGHAEGVVAVYLPGESEPTARCRVISTAPPTDATPTDLAVNDNEIVLYDNGTRVNVLTEVASLGTSAASVLVPHTTESRHKTAEMTGRTLNTLADASGGRDIRVVGQNYFVSFPVNLSTLKSVVRKSGLDYETTVFGVEMKQVSDVESADRQLASKSNSVTRVTQPVRFAVYARDAAGNQTDISPYVDFKAGIFLPEEVSAGEAMMVGFASQYSMLTVMPTALGMPDRANALQITVDSRGVYFVAIATASSYVALFDEPIPLNSGNGYAASLPFAGMAEFVAVSLTDTAVGSAAMPITLAMLAVLCLVYVLLMWRQRRQRALAGNPADSDSADGDGPL